jgi:hypothetical protein
MRVQDNENTNIHVPFMWSGLDPFTITRKNGQESNFVAVWHRGNDDREFNLGPLAPAEVIKLKMGYDREIKASYSADTGGV